MKNNLTAIIVIILFTLLLMSCNEDEQVKQTEQLSSKLDLEICDSSCEKFAHSIISIDFSHSICYGCGKQNPKAAPQGGIVINIFHIAVTKTATGALVKYDMEQRTFPKNEKLEHLDIELDIGEWQNFARALYKCKINEWEKRYGLYTSPGDNIWRLEILSSNKDEPDTFSGKSEYPPNWKKFERVIDDMVEKIKDKAGNK